MLEKLENPEFLLPKIGAASTLYLNNKGCVKLKKNFPHGKKVCEIKTKHVLKTNL